MVPGEALAIRSNRVDQWWRLEHEKKMCRKDERVWRAVRGISHTLKAINGFREFHAISLLSGYVA